jgi:ribonuclease BN (tRNA processing enzyme)
VAKRAKVKKLALFHHAPEHTDDFLLQMEKKCKKRFPDALLAREGVEIKL